MFHTIRAIYKLDSRYVFTQTIIEILEYIHATFKHFHQPSVKKGIQRETNVGYMYNL